MLFQNMFILKCWWFQGVFFLLFSILSVVPFISHLCGCFNINLCQRSIFYKNIIKSKTRIIGNIFFPYLVLWHKISFDIFRRQNFSYYYNLNLKSLWTILRYVLLYFRNIYFCRIPIQNMNDIWNENVGKILTCLTLKEKQKET